MNVPKMRSYLDATDHGYIVSPQDLGLWDPFQMAMNMAAINGGGPARTTYIHWEQILQVGSSTSVDRRPFELSGTISTRLESPIVFSPTTNGGIQQKYEGKVAL